MTNFCVFFLFRIGLDGMKMQVRFIFEVTIIIIITIWLRSRQLQIFSRWTSWLLIRQWHLDADHFLYPPAASRHTICNLSSVDLDFFLFCFCFCFSIFISFAISWNKESISPAWLIFRHPKGVSKEVQLNCLTVLMRDRVFVDHLMDLCISHTIHWSVSDKLNYSEGNINAFRTGNMKKLKFDKSISKSMELS